MNETQDNGSKRPQTPRVEVNTIDAAYSTFVEFSDSLSARYNASIMLAQARFPR